MSENIAKRIGYLYDLGAEVSVDDCEIPIISISIGMNCIPSIYGEEAHDILCQAIKFEEQFGLSAMDALLLACEDVIQEYAEIS